MYKLGSLILGLVLSLSACNRSVSVVGDPKLRLTEYISRSFAITKVEEKDQLLAYLTGDVRTRLESWSPEQFREAFLDSKRQFIRLTVREIKPISEDEVQVTYELVYNQARKQGSGQKNEAKVTNKKLCQMVRKEHGQWYIADVRNIKELIEFQDELSLP